MTRRGMKQQETNEIQYNKVSWKTFKRFPLLIVSVCVYVAVFLLTVIAVTPQRHTVSVDEIATETITATKDVVDKITTDKLVEQARNSVTVQFKEDYNVTLQVNDSISAFFGSLHEVYITGHQMKDAKTSLNGQNPEFNWLLSLTTQEIAAVKAKCTLELTNTELVAILDSSESGIDTLNDLVSGLVTASLKERIKEQYLEERKGILIQSIQDSTDVGDDLKQLGVKAVNAYVKANFLIDEEATEKLRDEAEAQVSPVTYKKGQNIIVKGNIVTEAQIGVLDSLGLLSDNSVDLWLYVGIAIYLLIVFAALAIYLVLYMPIMLETVKNVIFLGTLTILVMAIAVLAMKIDVRLIPVAFISMLLSTIFSSRLAMFMNMMIVALVGGMLVIGANSLATSSLYAVFMYFGSGIAGAFATRRMQTRSALMMAGAWVALANVAMAVAIGFMSISVFTSILVNAAWGVANGVLCAVLCIGTLPIWESVFDVVTPTKLLELANPNHPLIKKLMLEAPGTYHHSVMVANLGEAAAEAIGANPLLTRVGAFFHDVGKLRRPYYYAENQIDGENPHDKMPYSSSVQIISSHPKDGVQYAAKCRVPKQVQDIIAQHHGSSILMYFYLKAKNEADIQGKEVDTEKFRYNGPKPKSREAALVMLADAVEAGVRAQSEKSPEAVRERVKKLVHAKIDDGQLNECNITFKEINQVIEVFIKVFASMFHERLEYPSFDGKEENETHGH
ncbi:MAG: HD family phosphohydrolase [Christensenellales bacterium]